MAVVITSRIRRRTSGLTELGSLIRASMFWFCSSRNSCVRVVGGVSTLRLEDATGQAAFTRAPAQVKVGDATGRSTWTQTTVAGGLERAGVVR